MNATGNYSTCIHSRIGKMVIEAYKVHRGNCEPILSGIKGFTMCTKYANQRLERNEF